MTSGVIFGFDLNVAQDSRAASAEGGPARPGGEPGLQRRHQGAGAVSELNVSRLERFDLSVKTKLFWNL